MLWRDLLRRDYEDFDGAVGLDLLRKQENSLTLSQSTSPTDWGDAPWQSFYTMNFNCAQLSSPAWISRFISNIEARQDHGCARCGDYLVVFAGFTGDRNLYALDTKAQVEKLKQIVTDESQPLNSGKIDWHVCDITGNGPNFLGMLYGHSLVTLDSSTLLLYGGMQAPGYQLETSEVWLLHLEQLDDNEMTDNKDLPFRWKWERPPVKGKIPQARAYHSATIVNGKFWIFGGTSSGRTRDDFWCLDLTTWEWEEVGDCTGNRPTPRMGHSCTKFGNEFVILGGTDSPYCQGGGNDFCDGYFFNTQTRTWRPTPVCPGRFIGRRHAATLVGHRIVVIAGSNPHTNDVAWFDLNSNTWTAPTVRGRKPSPRVSLSAHFCNGLVFVFGGCSHSGLSQELFLFDPCDYIGAVRNNRIEEGVSETNENDDFPMFQNFNFFTRERLRYLFDFGYRGDAEEEDE